MTAFEMESDMTYETPEVLELGKVDELTFGGEVWPAPFDSRTGYRGFIPYPLTEE